jgi:hypothetical protein
LPDDPLHASKHGFTPAEPSFTQVARAIAQTDPLDLPEA